MLVTDPHSLDYCLLFRALPGLYLVVTPSLTMVDSTDARLDATMTRRDEIEGRHLFDVFGDDPNDPEATGVKNLRASLERVLTTRMTDVMPIQKYSLRRPASLGGGYEERYWSPVNVPILDEDGGIRLIVHRVEDVTEFMRATNAVTHDAGEADDAATVKDRIATTVFRQAQDIQESNRRLRAAIIALEQQSDALREARSHAEEERRRAVEALEHMKGTETARARTEATVRLLGKVAIAANESPTASEAFRSAVQAVCSTLDWPIGHAMGVDGSSRKTLASGCCAHVLNEACAAVLQRATTPVTTVDPAALPARVVARGGPVFLEHLGDDPRFDDELLARAGVGSAIGLPVSVRREVRGVLEFFLPRTSVVDEETLDVLAQIGTQLGRVIEREEALNVRRQMLERLVTAQEEERLRISRELHDELGQHLVALAIGVQSLRATIPGDGVLALRIQQLEMLADRIGTDARQIATRLRPTLLDDFGLASAVRAHVTRWSEDTALPVELEVSAFEERRLPTAVETAVYRIIQEALTNVARHAEAKAVRVMVDNSGSSVFAIVEDDGHGFDPESAGATHRLGLLGMSERAALVGGRVTVESTPGAGTAVLVKIPIDRTTTTAHGAQAHVRA